MDTVYIERPIHSMSKVYHWIYGVSAGLVLCLICIFRSFLAFWEIDFTVNACLVVVTMLLGMAIAVFTLIFRRPSLAGMLLRFVVMFASFSLFFLGGSVFGIWRFLDQCFFSELTSDVSDNVSGLLMLAFFLQTVIVSVITVFLKTIRILIKKLFKSKKR